MKKYTIERLNKLGINPEILYRYNEPHRFYHNWNHINDMLTMANSQDILTTDLFLAIVFHDIVYDPKSTDNEEKSVELFSKYLKNDEVVKAIIDTKNHELNTMLSSYLCKLDLNVLYSDYETFINFEHNIFKEYQFLPYQTYKEKRIEVLESYNVCKEFINYVSFRKPNVGIYAGSFNPFHKGHLNILQKAEQIFDKVIIARGINTDKNFPFAELPKALKYHQIEYYDGLLTDFLEKIGNETLIRGLRNASDLEYEKTQYRYLQDLKPDIKIVSIFCDKEFEHISSSGIRTLQKFNKGQNYLI